ncbi:Receptor ligand binding region [Trinorchestia longiramus]|nr:Receptor ligand binding region [Trinorchestia longiramus]
MLRGHDIQQQFSCYSSCIVVFLGVPASAGGLFDRGDVRQEVAFQYAVERVNSVRSSFRRSRSRLQPVIEQIPPYDSFHASKRVCHLLRSGVAAIFGPQSSQTSAHVQSICDALEVPHIETRWDYRLRRDDYSVNLYPHPSSLSKAYLDLVRLFGWMSFCILYEDNEGLIRLQELLKTPSPQEFKISIRQLDRGSDFRPTLRDIKRLGETNILLDCQTDKIVEVLKQAQQIGMMTPYNNYIITSLFSLSKQLTLSNLAKANGGPHPCPPVTTHVTPMTPPSPSSR